MDKSALVLDFDGTIADAEAALIEIYKSIAQQNNWPKLTRKDYYRLKKGSPREVMKWAGVKIWQIPRLLRMGRKEYKKHIKDIKLFKDMPEVTLALSEHYDVYILSSNDESTVDKILKANGFKANVVILRGSSLFGKDKALKKLLKSHGYKAADSWMIGDEVRDVEAGKKAHMNTIGVTWGLQSSEGLAKAKPDFITKKPQDILNIILDSKK